MSCSTCSWVRAAHHAPKHAPKHVVPCAVNQLTSYAIMLSKLPCLQSLHTTRCLHPQARRAATRYQATLSRYRTLSAMPFDSFRLGRPACLRFFQHTSRPSHRRILHRDPPRHTQQPDFPFCLAFAKLVCQEAWRSLNWRATHISLCLRWTWAPFCYALISSTAVCAWRPCASSCTQR